MTDNQQYFPPGNERLCSRDCWRSCWYNFNRFFNKVLKFLFSHVGLCGLVVGYSVLGALIFQAVELPYEMKRKGHIANDTQDVISKILNYTRNNIVLSENNFKEMAHEALKTYELQIVFAAQQEGYDGDDNSETYQWSFSGSLLYSVTVITTIGYGHIAPKTDLGRLITVAYALIGIPLMLMCLATIAETMLQLLTFLYFRMCCFYCRWRKSRRLNQRAAITLSSRANAPRSVIIRRHNTMHRHTSTRRDHRPPLVRRETAGLSLNAVRKANSDTRSMRSFDKRSRDLKQDMWDTRSLPNRSIYRSGHYEGHWENRSARQNHTVKARRGDGKPLRQTWFDGPASSSPVGVHRSRLKESSLSPLCGGSPVVHQNHSTKPVTTLARQIADMNVKVVEESEMPVYSVPLLGQEIGAETPESVKCFGIRKKTKTMNRQSSRTTVVSEELSEHSIRRLPMMFHSELVEKVKFEDKPEVITPPSETSGSMRNQIAKSELKEKKTKFNRVGDDSLSPDKETLLTGSDDITTSGQVTASDEELRSEVIHRTVVAADAKHDKLGNSRPTISTTNTVIHEEGSSCSKAPSLDSHSMKSATRSASAYLSKDEKVPVLLGIFIVILFVLGGAVLFAVWEDWNLLDGAYFCVTTLTTIGFGDIVPGASLDDKSQKKLIICCIYLLFGMAIIAMCFKLMQDTVVQKTRWIGQKIGILVHELSDSEGEYDDDMLEAVEEVDVEEDSVD